MDANRAQRRLQGSSRCVHIDSDSSEGQEVVTHFTRARGTEPASLPFWRTSWKSRIVRRYAKSCVNVFNPSPHRRKARSECPRRPTTCATSLTTSTTTCKRPSRLSTSSAGMERHHHERLFTESKIIGCDHAELQEGRVQMAHNPLPRS